MGKRIENICVQEEEKVVIKIKTHYRDYLEI